MKLNRCVFVGLAALALGVTLLLIGRGNAGGGDKLAKSVDEVAAAIEKGDLAGAKKMAKDIAAKEEEIYYVMLLMKPRDKKGFGVGDKAGDVTPDGRPIGRNDPCWCGSGKKYKKCHGAS